MDNALCDWNLFHCLFVDLYAQSADLQSALNDAITITRENIKETLNTAATVFSVHTGCQTSACLQVIERLDGTSIEDAVMLTILRDRLSEARNYVAGAAVTHRVRENTLHRQIFIDRVDGIVINDLKAAVADPAFQTSSRHWDGVYNALLIAPIPNMPATRAKSAFNSGDARPPRATLCIDNRNGGFEKEPHMALARELAWRLGVMLYRLEWLTGITEQARENGSIQ
jgi:hypothetical protein